MSFNIDETKISSLRMKDQLKSMRWVCRGLSLKNAVNKVKIDNRFVKKNKNKINEIN